MSGCPKIFSVRSGMVQERRLDPEYHFALLNTSIKSPYPLVKLLSLAHFKTGGTPSTNVDAYWGGSLPWCSAKDFKTFRFEDTEDHITELAAQEATTYVVDKPALLMVSRSGILQHSLPVMVAHKRTAINQDIKAFFPDNRVTVDYLGAFFVLLGEKLLPLLCKSGATVQSLNTSELLNLQIPVPPPAVQNRIVAELDAAYAAKRKADERATQLLASIDDVVFSELGIPKLPPQDTTLDARVFIVSSRNVVERTLSPTHYTGNIDFSKSKFPCYPFLEIVKMDPLETESVKPPYRLVPMEAVSAEYGSIDRVETIPAGDMGGYSRFRDGDVICAKISPCMENGKSAVVSTGENGLLFGSTEFSVFRPEHGRLLPEYLHLLLRMKCVRENAGRHLSGTTGHQRVTKRFFADLEIPIPPCPDQRRIVEKVSAIREKAKRLKRDAADALADAKKRLEQKILKTNA